MATKSNVSSSAIPTTPAERLRAYRAAAASLKPAATAAQPTAERSAAEVIGKAAADGRNFFTNVAAVYKVERQLGAM